MDITWFENSIDKTFKFWNFLRISEKQFFEQAESGDLILCAKQDNFKLTKMGRPKTPKIERVFILMRLDQQWSFTGNVQSMHHVLRIDSEQGKVVLEPWRKFKEYISSRYVDLFFRHLYINRTPNFLDRAALFCEDQLDGLDNSALMSERSLMVSERLTNNTNEEDTSIKRIPESSNDAQAIVDGVVKKRSKQFDNTELVARFYQ